jgi:hypothetical protein
MIARGMIMALLTVIPVLAVAQENLVEAYNTCVTDRFMAGFVILGNQRALDQAEGACGHLIDQAYFAAERAGEPGRNILDRLTRNKIQLEQRLQSMFPERGRGQR